MPNRDIIVIGASMGGIEAIRRLLAGLPADLPATIFCVVHTSSSGPDLVARVRSALILGEVALATVLLAMAVLHLRSLIRLQRVDPGFDPERVLAATGGHKSRTAQILGVSRPRLDRLLAKHGLE